MALVNIYAPERHADESMAQYRERRKRAKDAGRRVAAGSILTSGYHTNPRRNAERRAYGGKNAKQIKAERRLAHKRARPGDEERVSRWLGRVAAVTHPTFPKGRVHKQKKHALRDQHGAYTLTGSVYSCEGVAPTDRDHVISGGKDGEVVFFTGRRKWLAGVSAQRGY